MATTRIRKTLITVLLGLLTTSLVAGCAGAGDSDDSAPSVATADRAEAPAEAGPPGSAGGPGDDSASERGAPEEPSGQAAPISTQPRSLIRTATIALSSDDAEQARFDVRKVISKYRAEVSQENTDSAPGGDVERTFLTIRVPADDFDRARAELEGIGTLESSSVNTEDVSTQVIDTDVRVKQARRSIERISVLLEQAAGLGDIISIESELARREADLASLLQQQEYLSDQTAMSTITLSIEQTDDEERDEAEQDEATGFMVGLEKGWEAMKSAGTALATVAGALLPFLLLLALLGYPLRLLVRRLNRDRGTGLPPAPPMPPAPAPAP